MNGRRRLLAAFGVAGVLATMGSVGWWASKPAAVVPRARLSAPPAAPYLLFVSLHADDSFRQLATVPLSAPDGPIYVAPQACDRVYFAGGRGICLASAAEGRATKYVAHLLDGSYQPTHTVPLTGSPSRVRVSADGRRAAATVFESGHAYNMHGFSTKTTVIDLESGRTLGDLEQFTVFRDGARFYSEDFNFWGLTFARDGNRFYATLDTKGVSYLVEGDIDRRTMTVVRSGVECPSLSPDNTRIMFKKRIGSRTSGWWQLTMLELATLKETVMLAETRSVDDQVEWLDDRHVMYHLDGAPTDVWVLPVDGSAPRRYVPAAYSPAVVR